MGDVISIGYFWDVCLSQNLPVRELPEGIQPPVVQVQTDYKSASTEIIDEEITQKIRRCNRGC